MLHWFACDFKSVAIPTGLLLNGVTVQFICDDFFIFFRVCGAYCRGTYPLAAYGSQHSGCDHRLPDRRDGHEGEDKARMIKKIFGVLLLGVTAKMLYKLSNLYL